jgi:outer membrane protein
MLKRITAMRDARLKSDLDVSMGQQNLDQGNLLLVTAQGDLDTAYAKLSEALGLGSSRQFRLTDETATAPPPGDFDAVATRMIANNPALAAEKAARDSAHKQADASGKAYLPTISALAATGYSPIDDPSQHLGRTYGAVGLSLSVPLFSGGLLEAQEAEDKAKASAADHAVDDLNNRMVRDLRASYDGALTAYRDIDVTSRLLGNTEKSLRLIQAGFDIGRNSSVDVSQAELVETQAAIGNADAKYDYLVRLAALKFQTGELLHDAGHDAWAPTETELKPPA